MSAFEKVEHTAPPPASPRSVGYTFAAVSAIAAVLLRNHVQLSLALAGAALLFALVAFVAPRWLKGLAYLWGLLALGLAKIVNPLVILRAKKDEVRVGVDRVPRTSITPRPRLALRNDVCLYAEHEPTQMR